MTNLNRNRQARGAWLGLIGVILLCGAAALRAQTTQPISPEQAWATVPRILERIKAPTFPERDFPITEYGAVAGETHDASDAIRKAIDACNAAGGGRVVVPAGVFMTGPVTLKSNVNLQVAEGATLMFKTDSSAYLPAVFTRWEGMECYNYSPFIYAFEQDNIAITGSGTLDGQASNEHWWPWTNVDRFGGTRGRYTSARSRLMQMVAEGVPVEQRQIGEGGALRPNFIQPYRCRNVLIEGVRIRRSPMWEVHPVLCTNVTIRGLDIVSHGPNNDGCNPESCKDVLIENCTFDTGDDCIAIKSGRNNDGRRVNVASENIIIRNCVMKDGHGGVTIGSEISGSCRNVFVENCEMDSANLDRALRLKSNAVRGGVIENVYFRNVTVGQVADAVLQIDFRYEEGANGPHKPVARNIVMQNVTVKHTPRVLNIAGFPGAEISNVRIMNSTFLDVARDDAISDADVKIIDSKIERQAQVRQRQLFDFGWQFNRGDFSGAQRADFNASAWRGVDLPHDWSIEGPWAQDNPTAGPGGFLPAGIGWYRKSFALPEAQRGKQFTIEFDGVYMNSDVWINGQHLGKWPFGYSSFAYDLTPHLKFGTEPNVLAVRIDNSRQPESRWYSGSGITRNVWLTVTDPLRVGHWGTYVTIPSASATSATVRARTTIQNDRPAAQAITLTTQLVDPAGVVAATSDTLATIPAGGSQEVDQTIILPTPKLWSIKSPDLYTVRSIVNVGDQVADDYTTPIGVREIAYDLNKGFLLNGQQVKMLGVCLHHDGGNLGAAVPAGVWERRLRILKEMGCNAIRTSHNPPDPVLLDLCDRMGFLVMDEAFDEWTIRKPQIQFGYSDFFNDWYERDVINLVRRDRNHPSVVMWSAGNEIGEQRAAVGPEVLGKLMAVFHREDPTRPVTVGMDNVFTDRGPAPEAFTSLPDIVGYNYVDRWGARRETYYSDDRHNHPQWKFVGTESSSIGGTRNAYTLPSSPSQAQAARGEGAATGARAGAPGRGGRSGGRGGYANSMIRAAQLWKFVKSHDYVIGDFMWTGIDYLGETSWPRKGSSSGQIDTAGFPKDGYYFYQSQWTADPMIHLMPHWNWPGQEGRLMPVVAYTNCDTVELFLNGKSFGAKSVEFPRQGNAGNWNTYARPYVAVTTADLHLAWDVPYEPGTLRAVGYRNGQVAVETQVRTAGAPAAIVMTADRGSISADARDVAHFTVKVVDDQGTIVPGADTMITFDLSGPAKIIATDNGNLADLSPPASPQRQAFGGMALAIIQATRETGKIRMTARAERLKEAVVELDSKMP